jgi:hypothetical protein
MIATIVALREKGGDVQGAEIVLDNAVEYWRNHTGDDVRSTLETIIQVLFKPLESFLIYHHV